MTPTPSDKTTINKIALSEMSYEQLRPGDYKINILAFGFLILILMIGRSLSQHPLITSLSHLQWALLTAGLYLLSQGVIFIVSKTYLKHNIKKNITGEDMNLFKAQIMLKQLPPGKATTLATHSDPNIREGFEKYFKEKYKQQNYGIIENALELTRNGLETSLEQALEKGKEKYYQKLGVTPIKNHILNNTQPCSDC